MLAHVVAGRVDEVPVFVAMSTPRGHTAQEVPEQSRTCFVLPDTIPDDISVRYLATVIHAVCCRVQCARALLAIGLVPVPNQQGRKDGGGILRHVIQPP